MINNVVLTHSHWGLPILLRLLLLVACAVVWMAPTASAWSPADGVIAEIRERGRLRCGVSFAPGFYASGQSGRPEGMMIDLCRALAAAVLGRADAIEPVRLEAGRDAKAIAARDVDVALTLAPWTLSRDAGQGVDFGPPILFDTLAVAGWRRLAGRDAVRDAANLVCVQADDPGLQGLRDHIERQAKPWQILAEPSWEAVLASFAAQKCEMLSGPRLAVRASLQAAGLADRVQMLSDGLADIIVAPVSDSRDRQWGLVVRWALQVLMLAEEYRITAESLAIPPDTIGGEAGRLLADVSDVADLGLARGWVRATIAAAGHYGEIFDRHLGKASPFAFPRQANRPWSQGGLLYAPVYQ